MGELHPPTSNSRLLFFLSCCVYFFRVENAAFRFYLLLLSSDLQTVFLERFVCSLRCARSVFWCLLFCFFFLRLLLHLVSSSSLSLSAFIIQSLCLLINNVPCKKYRSFFSVEMRATFFCYALMLSLCFAFSFPFVSERTSVVHYCRLMYPPTMRLMCVIWSRIDILAQTDCLFTFRWFYDAFLFVIIINLEAL